MDAEQQRAAQTALKKSISSALTKLSTVRVKAFDSASSNADM